MSTEHASACQDFKKVDCSTAVRGNTAGNTLGALAGFLPLFGPLIQESMQSHAAPPAYETDEMQARACLDHITESWTTKTGKNVLGNAQVMNDFLHTMTGDGDSSQGLVQVMTDTKILPLKFQTIRLWICVAFIVVVLVALIFF